MKESKRKIRRTNIRRRTKKTNYRKIQRGGWSEQQDPERIRQLMTNLPKSADSIFTDVRVEFPFNNINMDIIFPATNLNAFMIEKENEYIEPVKIGLSNSIMALKQDKTRNQQILSENPSERPHNIGAIIDEIEVNINRDSILLDHLNSQNQPLNFSIVPSVIDFIVKPEDISQFPKDYDKIVLSNNFDGAYLEEKQSTAGVSEPNIPKEVWFLIKIMKQLGREINGSAIYINDVKQSFEIDAKETLSSGFDAEKPKFKTASNRYGNILREIREKYSGPELDFRKKNFEILACLVEDNVGQAYFLSFIQNILDVSNSGMFIFFEACRDYVIVPEVKNKDGEIEKNVKQRHRDSKALVDQYINFYREKYKYDTTYFGLKQIQENPEDGNFLQYVKNGTTFLITVGTDIIIEFVRIYYIYVRDVGAQGKRIYSMTAALKNPLKPFDRAPGYDNLIMAVIVVKKTVNINTGVITYENNFRWIINQHTLNNMTQSGNMIPDIFLKNLEEVRLEDYSTATKVAKGVTGYFKGVFGGPSAAALPEEEKEADLSSNESFAVPGSGIKIGPLPSANPQQKSAAVAEGEEGEWQQVDYNKYPDDVDVGGRKKNKTRKRSNKRSKKRKAKY
jgi:hypothetical protein